ncbi:hypothetical protein BDN67DRAFT_913201, partial [Paxillus ammoniavirescens]
LIPEFWIILISTNYLSVAGLSTTFLASSSTCYVLKERTPILTGTHQQGLYYTNVTPEFQRKQQTLLWISISSIDA